MTLFRANPKTDDNQAEIVAALRKIGASVVCLYRVGGGCPDLLVGMRDDCVLMEVKSELGALSKNQRTWHNEWKGPRVVVVRDVDDALREAAKLGG